MAPYESVERTSWRVMLCERVFPVHGPEDVVGAMKRFDPFECARCGWGVERCWKVSMRPWNVGLGGVRDGLSGSGEGSVCEVCKGWVARFTGTARGTLGPSMQGERSTEKNWLATADFSGADFERSVYSCALCGIECIPHGWCRRRFYNLRAYRKGSQSMGSVWLSHELRKHHE